jgi:hypothetical protein
MLRKIPRIKKSSRKITALQMKEGEGEISGKLWILQFDGGSRGNPGLGGSGSVIYKSKLKGFDPTSNPKDIKVAGNEKAILYDTEEMWYGHHYLGKARFKARVNLTDLLYSFN